MTGPVLSILTVVETELDRPAPFVAEHVKVTPAEFAESVVVLQPVEDATPDSASVTLQATVTSLVYQPPLPDVPTICGIITGGVMSVPSPFAFAKIHTSLK